VVPTLRSGPHDAAATGSGDGNVWHGVLRLSDGPWQKPRGLRGEDLLPEGNSSRETSLSDDGSGASDGNPEVTMDEVHTTSPQTKKSIRRGVNFSHEGSNAVLLGGGGGEEEEGSGATGSGDPGGGAVTHAANALEADAVGGLVPHGSGRGSDEKLKKQTSISNSGPRRGGSRKGSFSGADVMGRAAGRAMAARGGAELVCSLIARAPPNNAGIPGTTGGEGQARAAAAGSAMPNVMEASIVRPRSEGWPDVWNPVALLRLFPSSSHPYQAEAFDRLVARLTPRAADDETEKETGTEAEMETETGASGGGDEVEASETTDGDDTGSIHSGRVVTLGCQIGYMWAIPAVIN
jgi:hypothetical protein